MDTGIIAAELTLMPMLDLAGQLLPLLVMSENQICSTSKFSIESFMKKKNYDFTKFMFKHVSCFIFTI